MRVIDGFVFKDRRRKKSRLSKHSSPVCEVIICTVASGYVERKSFSSWDDARMYRDQRMCKADKYRINIEPL